MNDGQDPAENQARRDRLKAKHGNGNGAGLTLGGAVQMWPTARAEDSESAGNHPGATDSLTGATSQWITPQTPNGGRIGTRNEPGREGKERNLENQAAQWATPNVPSRGEESRGSKAARGAGGVDLQTQASNWPTLGSNDHKGSARPGQRVGQLDEATEQKWQTPGTNMEGSGTSRGNDRAGELLLNGQACSLSSHLGQPIPDGPTSSAKRRRLNPQFVSWLMGWPVLAESGFAFSETEWLTFKRRQRSALLSVRLVEAGESGLFDAGGAA